MSPQSPVPRSHSRASCYSTTTYHSFQDIELYEPGCTPEAKDSCASRILQPSESRASARHRSSRKDDFEKQSFASRMVRQDSGYESSTPSSKQYKRPRNYGSSQYATSSPSPTTDSQSRKSSSQTRQQRPSLRRSRPISTTMARSSLTISRSPQRPQHNDPYSYFQFPSPEQLEEQQKRQSADLAPVILTVNKANQQSTTSITTTQQQEQQQQPANDLPIPSKMETEGARGGSESPLAPLPPQTTHYWTSDRTRRLEYAAIDAASRGVRGWIMRNCVPECFVPRERRRVGFEDDSGSVRRYRLDLEIECPEDSVPPSPVGEKPRGFRARGRRSSFWAKLRGRD